MTDVDTHVTTWSIDAILALILIISQSSYFLSHLNGVQNPSQLHQETTFTNGFALLIEIPVKTSAYSILGMEFKALGNSVNYSFNAPKCILIL